MLVVFLSRRMRGERDRRTVKEGREGVEAVGKRGKKERKSSHLEIALWLRRVTERIFSRVFSFSGEEICFEE